MDRWTPRISAARPAGSCPSWPTTAWSSTRDDQLLPIVLDELEHARRPQQFERRTPLYGSIIVPADRSLIEAGELVDLIPLDGQSADEARRFADGRSVFIAVQPDGTRMLACFRRSVQYEADMVEIQSDTGAFIVQRTPVLGVTRLFTESATIEWTGYRWTSRPTARAQHELLQPFLRGIATPVLSGLLELAVHWLSPGRVGATLVVPVTHGDSGLDLSHAIATPDLSVTARHHYPAILAALMQTDLATIVDAAGRPTTSAWACTGRPRPSRRSTSTAACATARRPATRTTTPTRWRSWSARTARSRCSTTASRCRSAPPAWPWPRPANPPDPPRPAGQPASEQALRQ